MKGLWIFLISLSLLETAQADPVSKTITNASKAYAKNVVETMWNNRCSRPDALRLYPNCYVNHEGTALWEMSGIERERWKRIAVQESVRLQQKYRMQVEVAKEEGRRAAQESRMSHQMCDFWRQQAESERQKSKVLKFCKN
ncbi:hypothetical protein [Marinobacter sp. DUT-1]|uniref:hypothetical protein n=1 Tax=Marinobacter sp. DUT-1 TaxID=3412037 RepID=UPI003D17B6F8